MTSYRGKNGIYSINITGSLNGRTVWGTDIYTDDSDIRKAAIHAGVIANGERKTIIIEVIPGNSSYVGTTRNGVTTSSYGSWGGSYRFISSSQSQSDIAWQQQQAAVAAAAAAAAAEAERVRLAEEATFAATKTSAIALATEAITIADSAFTVANEALVLGGPSDAAANTAKTDAGLAKTAATAAKTAAEGATTVPLATAAKTAATDAKTKATAAKTAADAAKAGNLADLDAKCKTPAFMTFVAKVQPNAAIPTSGPVSPNVYWTTDTTETTSGVSKDFIWLPMQDKSGVNFLDALTHCGKVGKFLILYINRETKDRNIQYKILRVMTANNYFKFNVEKVRETAGFTKANILDGQDIFIRTSESEIISQGPSLASSTFKNACSGPNPSANCKPVCIPTDASGNIIYKEGTSIPNRIVESNNQWLANYYEYKEIKGIRSDGIVEYLPMDSSVTFVGAGTNCDKPCPPQDVGGVRPAYCRAPDPNWGQKPAAGEIGRCPIGCIKVKDPTSRRNSSACTYNKSTGYTCKAVCDFNAGSTCKRNTDCANCSGSDYIAEFRQWTTTPRVPEKVYSYDDCSKNCKKATVDICRNFLQLEQDGGYLESRCRKIGSSGTKAICGPISKSTPTGLVAGYDNCITCRANKELYGYFEYEKQWNKITKQWDFINIKEIPSPSSTWFEGDSNSFSDGSGAGSRGRRGEGTNLRGSRSSEYQEDADTRGARDSREMGKLQSNDKSKSVSISSASQNAKRQEDSAKVSAMKIRLDKMTNEYKSLEDNVKWNKMQMEKAEKDCRDINVRLKKAIGEYAKAEAISMRDGPNIKEKEKKNTEAAKTLAYSIKQKAREICEDYDSLKSKYMKSVDEMNSLKNKIEDLQKKYNTASASISGGSGSGGSLLSPIINIFFGNDANRDCSGQLGCGNGIDYSFPSPFNSSKGGMFTPQPFYGGIRL
jgi:hypothetical protein